MREETDPRALGVLERALGSTSRATRIRAVAMLACVGCASRRDWLERACLDPDPSVSETALAVCSWVEEPEQACWPQREDLATHDRNGMFVGGDGNALQPGDRGDRWQYTVEIWTAEGLPVGVFTSTSFDGDDVHARHIALGQAILASVGEGGDAFDPSTAAAFIVNKERTFALDSREEER